MSGQPLTCLGSNLERNLGESSSWSKVAGEHVMGPEMLVGKQQQWEWQGYRAASSAEMLSNTEN